MSQFDAQSFLKHLSTRPGVYCMYDHQDERLYVGKAKNLKNRVSSYFRASGLNNKTVALVAKIARIEVTITHSETEALLLEHTLISQFRPPYNILLVDDKSYPYIFVSTEHNSPGIFVHRGKKGKKGAYFGPFPNTAAVRESMQLLQQTFKIRQCEDTVFANRSRPCLQYQIKRCKAPCVNKVTPEDYQQDLEHTMQFLQGKNAALIEDLQGKMDTAAQNLHFEQAAEIRDQMLLLRKVQEQQFVAGKDGDADVFAMEWADKGCCVHYMSVRKGRILGSRSFFPKLGIADQAEDVISAFLSQFYLLSLERSVPASIIVSHNFCERQSLQQALASSRGHLCSIKYRVRGVNLKWLELAKTNASEQLQLQISQKMTIKKRYQDLQVQLNLPALPKKMECFDISHNFGEATVASCVVFDQQGPAKRLYRSFNIKDIIAGDDVAAMRQAITRRYSRLIKEGHALPDVLLVDGGKGQFNMAKEVLFELGIASMTLIGVAKGETRKSGFETLFVDDASKPFEMASHSPAFHLIQHIRDESHRFAILKHRKQRDKTRVQSQLDQIPTVGVSRKKALLRHFASVSNIKSASVQEIAKVDGISVNLAQKIYDYLHTAE